MSLSELIELVKGCDNPELATYNDGEKIYHIYNDGEITEQKGGDMYLRRNERTLREYYDIGHNFDHTEFPHKTSSKKYGYAIVTHEDALKIRDLMIKLKPRQLIRP